MGLGAAVIFPATLSLLTNVFTERRERARPIGLWGATTGVGIAVGPIVGGWLLERFSWTSVFFALAPLGGFALAGALLVAFVAWERQCRAPMLDVGLFRNVRFRAASGAVSITFFSLLGFIFLVTLYFQFLKGYGPLSTGVRLLPVAAMVGITSIVGTSLAVRAGTKLVVAGGLVSLAAGLAWTSSASESTDYTTIVGQMV
jgi:MFS family permease